jgi:hypothetical protein
MYCTTDEAFATAGITLSEVSVANMTTFILSAEKEVDRLTNTTQWAVEDNGTVSSATDSTLVDSSKTWIAEDYIGEYIWIYSGTGSGQARLIEDNDTTSLTIDRDWDTNPDSTSKYRIIHTGNDPYINNELRDGNDTDSLFLKKYPLQILESVTIDSVSVTPSYIYQYKDTGELILGTDDVEVSYWTSKKAQRNVLSYWFGEYPIDGMVKRLCMVYAALKGLMAQAGGTHNIPSTYSLPEGSLTIGQAYINIRGAWDMLNKEKIDLESKITKYPYFA